MLSKGDGKDKESEPKPEVSEDSIKDLLKQNAEILANTAKISAGAPLNTLDGIYGLLCKRWGYMCEAEEGGLSEENKLMLEWLESKLHGAFPDGLVDEEMESWIKEYRDKHVAAKLKRATGKTGAKSTPSSPSVPTTGGEKTKTATFPNKKAQKAKVGKA